MSILSTIIPLVGPILPLPPTGTPQQIVQLGIDFFALWIARIGGVVAFVGAIKFALGIKSDEAQEKIQGLLTMISGFMIVSAVQSMNLFATGGAGGDAEFANLMGFITSWTAALGAVVMFIGAIMFAFGIREENPSSKITGTKTFAAGAVVLATSQALNLFVV